MSRMKTEGLKQTKAENSLHFDAHEFDGLRETLEKEAAGLLARVDRCIRRHPLASALVAAAAGVAVGTAIRMACSRQAED